MKVIAILCLAYFVNNAYGISSCNVHPQILYTEVEQKQSHKHLTRTPLKEVPLKGYITVIAFINSNELQALERVSMLGALKNSVQSSNGLKIQLVIFNLYASQSNEIAFRQIQQEIGRSGLVIQEKYDKALHKRPATIQNNIFIVDRCAKISYRIMPSKRKISFFTLKNIIILANSKSRCGFCNIPMKHFPTTKANHSETRSIKNFGKINLIFKTNISISESTKQNENKNLRVEHDKSKTNQQNKPLVLVSKSNITEIFKKHQNVTAAANSRNKGITTSHRNKILTTTSRTLKINARNNTALHVHKPNPVNTSNSSKHLNDKQTIHRNVTNNKSVSTNDSYLPLKIILHSPHNHTYGGKVFGYEYVVLKYGYPRFHGHIGKSIHYEQPKDLNKSYLKRREIHTRVPRNNNETFSDYERHKK